MARNSTARARTHAVPSDAALPPRTPLKLVYSASNPDAPAALERGAGRHLVAFHRGYVHFLNRQLEKALDSFRKSIEFEPDVAEAHYNLGYLLAETDELADALTAFRDAIKIKEDFAAAYLGLGWTLGALDRSAEAIGVYDDLLARFGTASELALRELVANALFNKGSTLGALDR